VREWGVSKETRQGGRERELRKRERHEERVGKKR
jgi:hypothetical protein